jgi:hypothetical protein
MMLSNGMQCLSRVDLWVSCIVFFSDGMLSGAQVWAGDCQQAPVR